MNRNETAAVLLLVFLVVIVQSASCEEAIVDSLSFSVFLDGYVYVEHDLLVESEDLEAETAIYGQAVTELFVVDEEGILLGYSLNGSEISVYTLDSKQFKVSYYTQELTHKDGRFWSLNLSTPLDCTIHMPLEATIVGFNKVPDLIESKSDEMLLFMSAGEVEIRYIVGVVGTKEYAKVLLDEVQQIIYDLKAIGINVSASEGLLDQGWDYFELGSYSEAETLANQAKTSALQTNQTASQAKSAIDLAESEIANMQAQNSGVNFDEAIALLMQSQSAYESGNYVSALALADDSYNRALELSGQPANSPNPSSTVQFPVIEMAGILSVVAITSTAGFVVFKYRNNKKTAKQAKFRQISNMERIFKRNQLRKEEQDAIRAIYDNNGELLEAELYTRLNLPRTTTWRLVRRLEKMGIVEITKFRRDNLIKLKK